MFGPEVAPAILTHGHSFAERLAGDEELVAEICKRFESARSEGRFPILSALLTETSDKDLEGVLPVRLGSDGTSSARNARPTGPAISRPGMATWKLTEKTSTPVWPSVCTTCAPSPASGSRSCYASVIYGMEESLGLPLKQQSGDVFSPPGSRPIR